MQQTLLALCALLAFSLYALSRHRDDASLERTSITSDSESSVAEVARARMADLDRLAFDEQDVGRTGMRTIPPTSPIGADDGEPSTSPYDDIDDLNGVTEDRAVPAGQGTLPVRVTFAVRYVNASTLGTSASPTMAKEVHIHVAEVTAGRTGRPPVFVDLKKVFTPAGMGSLNR